MYILISTYIGNRKNWMIKAKIFKNGYSQGVRLPKNFRIEGSEVSITRLGSGIVLQPIIATWENVFDKMSKIKADEILINREDTVPIDKAEFTWFTCLMQTCVFTLLIDNQSLITCVRK